MTTSELIAIRDRMRAPNSELFAPAMRAFQVQIKDGATVRLNFPACGKSKVAVQQQHECLADGGAGEQCIVLTMGEYAERRYRERAQAASPFEPSDEFLRAADRDRTRPADVIGKRLQERDDAAADNLMRGH